MSDYTRTIKNNPTLEGLARMTHDIVFTQRPGADLTLELIHPWDTVEDIGKDKRYPAIVFVQGSGWTFPDVWFEIPQLSELARRGYIIATVTHRSTKDGHAVPAFLRDVKTAIRFLRHHADHFRIDPERIGIWGTSSGGNTALLCALTADRDVYRTDEWAEQSDHISVCVDCFGPADVDQQFETVAPEAAETFCRMLLQNYDKPFKMEDLHFMSPIHLLERDMDLPPFLLIHGNADDVVNYEQSVDMHEKLLDLGYTSDLITVDGAPHEGSFWSDELLQLIFRYIEEHL